MGRAMALSGSQRLSAALSGSQRLSAALSGYLAQCLYGL